MKMDLRRLAELESEAGRALAGLMQPFNVCGKPVTACPNLRFSVSTGGSPDVILIMQDWGTGHDADDAELAVPHIGSRTLHECFRENNRARADRTLCNLIDAPVQRGSVLNREAILSGSLYLMNAVWGVRDKSQPKCGLLPARTHDAAFPVWSAVASFFARRKSELLVILAGQWGHRYAHIKLPGVKFVQQRHPCLWKMKGYPEL
jgi:hypothetical protein